MFLSWQKVSSYFLYHFPQFFFVMEVSSPSTPYFILQHSDDYTTLQHSHPKSRYHFPWHSVCIFVVVTITLHCDWFTYLFHSVDRKLLEVKDVFTLAPRPWLTLDESSSSHGMDKRASFVMESTSFSPPSSSSSSSSFPSSPFPLFFSNSFFEV